MDTRKALEASMDMSGKVAAMYLEDLTEDEIFERPVPGTNHIAWQLGHLISSENQLMSGVKPGAMPALPEGLAEKHTTKTADIDDRAAFLRKDEYLSLMKEQRAATKSILAELTDEELDKPAPEAVQKICRTVGDVIVLVGSHVMMHAGQWAVLRRKLGRPPIV